MTSSGFAYIWEYRVKPSSEDTFREYYGPAGAWVELFRRADGYLGTRLYRDISDPGRFVTVDRWASEKAFRAFRKRFRAEFERLDGLCESLTESETALGEFATAD